MGCSGCGTAQLDTAIDKSSLFTDYFYQTPKSQLLQRHYDFLIDHLLRKSYITPSSKVLEIGSNNGLFLEALSPHIAKCIGVEPVGYVAQKAIDRGIESLIDFFNPVSASKLIESHGTFDLIVARHCMAHNADLRPIVEGMEILLSDNGAVIIENPYWPTLVDKVLFDQIYHEHIYYHSVSSIEKLFETSTLNLHEVLNTDSQGGSKLYILGKSDVTSKRGDILCQLKEQEHSLKDKHFYSSFQEKIIDKIGMLREQLDQVLDRGGVVHGYGASAKSFTLFAMLNITAKQIPYLVDNTDNKLGTFLPDSEIQVIDEITSLKNAPDCYLITVWNYAKEIKEKINSVSSKPIELIIPHE